MKLKKIIIHSSLVVAILFISGCGDSALKPELYSETASQNVFTTLNGVNAVLYGAYANLAEMGGNDAAQGLLASEIMTDVAFVTQGAIANWATNFQDFILDGVGSSMYGVFWNQPYDAIRNANLILENIDESDITDTQKTEIKAEARFIRAAAYYQLYTRFGPVPLRISTDQELAIPKASEQEMLDFIESEFLAVIPDLPAYGEEAAYGRAHKAAAMGFLVKFYLNTKQWQKSADMAQTIMDLGTFDLYPSYFELFQVKSEGNNEILWARTSHADLGREANISFMNFGWPVGFKSNPRTGLQFCDGCRNFATMVRLRDDFWASFDPNDERTSLIIREYINNDGDLINLLPPNDNVRPFKYWPADDFAGPAYGNDVPVIRYADILLSRAEALNEINGPNLESINLINQVRNRAGLNDLALGDFASKEALRDAIFDERSWEFYIEEQRRDDLIRQGTFISKAQQRGLPAKDYMVRYPIPQFALDANPKLKQNDGY